MLLLRLARCYVIKHLVSCLSRLHPSGGSGNVSALCRVRVSLARAAHGCILE